MTGRKSSFLRQRRKSAYASFVEKNVIYAIYPPGSKLPAEKAWELKAALDKHQSTRPVKKSQKATGD